MIRKMTCIECPTGCSLSVDVENFRVVKSEGNKCRKVEKYVISEVENPVRIFTSGVLAIGLNLKIIPVRTEQPITKIKLFK